MKTAIFRCMALFAALVSTQAMAQPAPGPSQPPGLYVGVLSGLITVSNNGGSTNLSTGQFGYTPSVTQPPVLVPKNPAIQFTPPPKFSSTSAGSTNSPSKSDSVDCEVR